MARNVPSVLDGQGFQDKYRGDGPVWNCRSFFAHVCVTATLQISDFNDK